VANSLEDGYKEQNRSHAKHESGLVVTNVLWSLGHDCEPCKSG